MMGLPQFEEDAATLLLATIRWPETDGRPICPRCGCQRSYPVSSRKRFKCADCGHHYSVLSGTPFNSSKLPHSKLVQAIILFQESKGEISALEMQRQLGIRQYKTAFILRHKIWEAHLDGDGLLAHQSYLWRGYWQGFNRFQIDESGRTIRVNKRGERRLAW